MGSLRGANLHNTGTHAHSQYVIQQQERARLYRQPQQPARVFYVCARSKGAHTHDASYSQR